jgi:hypothetical protein
MTNLSYDNIAIVNPGQWDASRRSRLYLMWAGAHAPTRGYVWATNAEEAFEQWVEYLDDHAPGCLSWLDYAGAALDLELPTTDLDKLSPKDAERLMAYAEMDMTLITHTTLTEGDCIPSWEWGLDEVDMTSDEADHIRRMCAEECQED